MLISLRIEPLSLHPCSKKTSYSFGGWWSDKACAVGGTKMLIDKKSLLSYYNGVYTKIFSKKRFLIYAYIASNPKITRQDLAVPKQTYSSKR